MISLFVLVDALGWELVKNRPFLADILPHRQELTTVFGFSSGAIPSILTGMTPEGHGHWNLFVYSPERSPFRWARFLRRLPTGVANHRVTRKAVSVISRKMSRFGGYFQIYGVPVEVLPLLDICEKEDIYLPGGLRPADSIFDQLKRAGVPYHTYTYHQFKDGDAVRQVQRDLRRGEARFYFVYLSELDAFLHDHIHDAAKVERELAKLERDIRQIHQTALEIDSEASFYVFSDHGMTPVRETFDLMGVIAGLHMNVPDDYLALYDSTMARFWFFHPEARERITAELSRLDCGKVVDQRERKLFGVDFADNRFGDLIFLMKPGCLMHPSHMGRVPWPGMHGFHPDHESSSASLLAREAPPIEVRNIRDMFRLMRLEAGLGGN